MGASVLHKVLVTKRMEDTEEIEVSAVTEQEALLIALSEIENAVHADIIDHFEGEEQ